MSVDDDRAAVTPLATVDDTVDDTALRPTSLDDVIGQSRVRSSWAWCSRPLVGGGGPPTTCCCPDRLGWERPRWR
jgi:hypothetical protein